MLSSSSSDEDSFKLPLPPKFKKLKLVNNTEQTSTQTKGKLPESHVHFTFQIKLVFSDNTVCYSDSGNLNDLMTDSNLNSVDANLASKDFSEGTIIKNHILIEYCNYIFR